MKLIEEFNEIGSYLIHKFYRNQIEFSSVFRKFYLELNVKEFLYF